LQRAAQRQGGDGTEQGFPPAGVDFGGGVRRGAWGASLYYPFRG
jgi:hypothetical protein